MSLSSRRELLRSVHSRYRQACKHEKVRILDEFVASTGYHRDYAITLLNGPIPTKDKAPSCRPKLTRKRLYTPEVQRVLTELWSLSSGLCGKRLVCAIPDLLDAMERHEQWSLEAVVRERLLSISPATADRLLSSARR